MKLLEEHYSIQANCERRLTFADLLKAIEQLPGWTLPDVFCYPDHVHLDYDDRGINLHCSAVNDDDPPPPKAFGAHEAHQQAVELWQSMGTDSVIHVLAAALRRAYAEGHRRGLTQAPRPADLDTRAKQLLKEIEGIHKAVHDAIGILDSVLPEG